MEKLAYCILMFHLGCLIVSFGAIILGWFKNIEILMLDSNIYNSPIKFYYLIFVYYPAQLGYNLKKKICK